MKKLPAHVLHALEDQGANLTAFAHLRPKDIHGRYHDVGSSSSTQPIPHRQRRQILSLFVGLIGAGLSVYNTYELSQVHSELEKAAHERSVIAHAVSELNTRTHLLAENLNKLVADFEKAKKQSELLDLASSIIVEVQALENHLVTVVNSALSQRLDASLVEQNAWNFETSHIRREARLRGNYDLAYSNPIEIVSRPAAVEMQWHGTMYITIPIPIRSLAQDMDLWEFQQLPILTPSGWAEVDIKDPFLLTLSTPSTVFVDFSQSQVDQCLPAGDGLLCPPTERTFVQNRRITGLHNARCLFSLYRNDDESVANHCRLRFIEQQADARRFGPRQFGFFSSWDDELRVSCMDGSRVTKSVESGLSIITLPIDCSAESNAVILRPHVEIEVSRTVRDHVLVYPPSIRRVMNATAQTLKALRKEEESLATHFAASPALDYVEKNLKTIGSEPAGSTSKTIWIVLGSVLGGLVLLFLLWLLMSKLCKGKKNGFMSHGGIDNKIVIHHGGYPQPGAPEMHEMQDRKNIA